MKFLYVDKRVVVWLDAIESVFKEKEVRISQLVVLQKVDYLILLILNFILYMHAQRAVFWSQFFPPSLLRQVFMFPR